MTFKNVIELLETQLKAINKNEGKIKSKSLKIPGVNKDMVMAQIRVMRTEIQDAIEILNSLDEEDS